MHALSAPWQAASTLLSQLATDEQFLNKVKAAGDCFATALKGGNQLLIAGNGGSAAEAQHLSSEIVGRYIKERRGYPAIALTTDTSILTAVGNDYNYDYIFSRQVEALGRPGDVFVGLSTSGNSVNIISALKLARAHGLRTVTLSGRDGGKMCGLADIEIVVPSQQTPRIQEAHLLIIHCICELLDEQLSS